MHAAVICLRAGRAGPEVLLIRTSSGKRWVIPKGRVEGPEAPAAAALRELAEEAGHQARVDPRPVVWGGWRGTQLVVFLGRGARPCQPAEPGRNPEWVPVATAQVRLGEQRIAGEADLLQRALDAAVERFIPGRSRKDK